MSNTTTTARQLTSARLDHEAQQRFDKTYITSSEIAQRLNVSRPAIHYRRRSGNLPGSIDVYGQQLSIWEREAIEPHLLKWEAELKERRKTS